MLGARARPSYVIIPSEFSQQCRGQWCLVQEQGPVMLLFPVSSHSNVKVSGAWCKSKAQLCYHPQ